MAPGKKLPHAQPGHPRAGRRIAAAGETRPITSASQETYTWTLIEAAPRL
ncbi:conserved hypothetical protein [Actinomyces sp. oral taxon 180 str. F0310]|nr:conserved hypothetical protein [Actinomyces sp. oral taxon 180 str. F0310]